MQPFRLFYYIISASSVQVAAIPTVQLLIGPLVSNGTEFYPAGDRNWSKEVTQRWDNYSSPTYFGAVKPVNERELQNIVRVASKFQIPFLATGGGHGVSATLGKLSNGLDVDLGNLNSVHLDAENNELTIGGATHFSQIIDLLYSAGKEIRCVGVLGATLGAGIGPLQGLHGVLLDSLESVRLVTATGELVTASEKENADLFWGIRGAGYNFGIVTSATYKVYNATNGGQVTNMDYLFPASANQSVWELMASFDSHLPAELAWTFFVTLDPSSESRLPVIVLNGQYFGPKEDAMAYAEPILSKGAIMSNISMVPWNDVLNAAFFGHTATNGACDVNNLVNIYSLALKRTDVSAWVSHFNDLAAFYEAHPDYHGRVLAQRFPNQAAMAIPDPATAYHLRATKIHLNMEGWYTDRSLDRPVTEFLSSARDKFQETSGFKHLSVYTNYAHGDEGPQAWYGGKLERLEHLKKEWDPDGVFSWYNPIGRSG